MELRVLTHVDKKLLRFVQGTHNELPGITLDFLLDFTFATNYSFVITNPAVTSASILQNATADFFEEFASPLIAGDADLACCTYYYVPQRAKRATVLLPLITEKFRGFFIQPGLNQKHSGIFYAPFGLTAAVIFYSITFISVLLATFVYWINQTHTKPTGLKNSFLKGSWWVLITYCLKNYTVPSKPTSLQIIAITTSLFFYIWNSTYSAFLLSTLKSTINPITSFDDLLTYDFSIYANPSLTLAIIKHPKNAKNYKKMSGRLSSFKLAASGGHVHVDSSDAYAYFGPLLGLPKADVCGKLSVVPYASGMSSGLYLRPNASAQLREAFNQRIARMGDVGLLHKFNTRYHNTSLLSCHRRSQKHLEMGMNYVANLFEIFIGMVALSFFTFLVELLWNRINKPNIQNNYLIQLNSESTGSHILL